MKRFIIGALLALAAVFAAVSCEVDGATVRTYEYTVTPADWHVDDANALLYAEFPNPSITRSALEHAAFCGYMFLGDYNTWTPLPYVYRYAFTPTTGMPYIVQETFRCEFSPEKVTFVIEDLDEQIPELPAADFVFKVARIY